MSTWSRTLSVAMFALLWLGAAAWLRHALVEPAELTARCDAAPWQSAVCSLRSATVQAFVHQRIGIASLALGLAALGLVFVWPRATVWRLGLAMAALATGCVALVLYAAAPGAVGVLLALLVLQRTPFNVELPA